MQLQICNSAGTLTGYFIGAFVTSRFGYRSVFFVAAIGALLALITSLWIYEDHAVTAERVELPQLIKVGKSSFLLFVTGVCLVGQMILEMCIRDRSASL